MHTPTFFLYDGVASPVSVAFADQRREAKYTLNKRCGVDVTDHGRLAALGLAFPSPHFFPLHQHRSWTLTLAASHSCSCFTDVWMTVASGSPLELTLRDFAFCRRRHCPKSSATLLQRVSLELSVVRRTRSICIIV